jgi:hypothetical protein
LYNHLLYLLYWFANALVLYSVSLLFPKNVVLGNFRFGDIESAIYAGFWVTVLLWAMWDYVYVKNVKLEKLSGRFIVFSTLNFVSFWLVSRFSHLAGFGISSFWWAIFLGLIANSLQRFFWGLVVGRRIRAVAV